MRVWPSWVEGYPGEGVFEAIVAVSLSRDVFVCADNNSCREGSCGECY